MIQILLLRLQFNKNDRKLCEKWQQGRLLQLLQQAEYTREYSSENRGGEKKETLLHLYRVSRIIRIFLNWNIFERLQV